MTLKHTHTHSPHPTGELLPGRGTPGHCRGAAPHSIKSGRSSSPGGALVKIDYPTRSTSFALGRKTIHQLFHGWPFTDSAGTTKRIFSHVCTSRQEMTHTKPQGCWMPTGHYLIQNTEVLEAVDSYRQCCHLFIFEGIKRLKKASARLMVGLDELGNVFWP